MMFTPRAPSNGWRITCCCLLLLLCCGTVTTHAAVSQLAYHYCRDTRSGHLHPDLVGISAVRAELPALAGEVMLVNITAKPRQDVTGGTVWVDVSALGMYVGRNSLSVCGDLGFRCPVKKGQQVTAVLRYPVPWWSPKVHADVTIEAHSESGQPLLCLHADGVPVERGRPRQLQQTSDL